MGYITERLSFSVLFLSLLQRFELTFIIRFLLNLYYTSSCHFLFNWLLSVIIVIGYTINVWLRTSLKGTLFGKIWTCLLHWFLIKYNLKFFLTLPICYIVVVNQCPIHFDNFPVEFSVAYIIARQYLCHFVPICVDSSNWFIGCRKKLLCGWLLIEILRKIFSPVPFHWKLWFKRY